VSGLSLGTGRRSKPAAGDRHSATSLCAVAAAPSAGMFDVRLSAAVQTRL